MSIQFIPLTSFSGGEWSPRLRGRVDITKYSSAAEILQNMIVYPHGGITRRMGLEYIEEAKTDDVRLIPFEYNREQAYILEFGENYIRFFRNGAQIVNLGVPIEVVTTYSSAEIRDLAFAQSADVLYLVHPDHPPKKIQRTGPDTFSLTTVSFTAQPADWTSNNYPGTITFFQSRLCFGGNKTKPQTIWMSKVSSFEDMTSSSTANDGKVWTLSSTQVNSIQWLCTGPKLMIGTTGGEFSLELPDNSNNIQVRRESNYGSKTGRVQLIGGEVVYVSRDGKKIRGMAYSYEANGFISPELSLLSEHLMRPGIKEFDFAQNPDGILWTVMNDGGFSGLTYLKAQEVQAWHRHQTNGLVKSVCTIEGDVGSETWMAVTRNNGDNQVTLIERMAAPFDGDSATDMGCAYVDSFLTYEGAPIDTLSGLDHLEGMEVSILGDGQTLPKTTVVDGSINLPIEVSKAIVGLPYEWRYVPLQVEVPSPTGFSQGKKKSIIELIVRFEKSAGMEFKIPGGENRFQYFVPSKSFGQNFGEAAQLTSKDLPIKLPLNWDRDGQFELRGEAPLPVTILMISAKVAVNE